MRNKYGYDSYRGRSFLHNLLKGIALLLVLVVVVGALLSVFLGRNIIVSSEGVRFDFGWGQTSQVEATPSTDVVLVTPSPEPVEEAEEPYFQVLPMDQAALSDGTAVELAANWESNALILDMKPDSGSLGFVSQSDWAKSLGTSASNESLNATIQAVTATPELYTVARVSAFRDDIAPYQSNSMALRASYGNWRDEAGSRWLNPGNESAQQYILDVCLELATLGFDEILLDNAAYPTQGSLESITTGENYNPETLEAQMADFYTRILATLSDYPQVKVALVTDVTTLTGEGNASGQQAVDLVEFDRVWCPEMGNQGVICQKTLTDAGMEDVTRNLVDIRTAPGETRESWAILPK